MVLLFQIGVNQIINLAAPNSNLRINKWGVSWKSGKIVALLQWLNMIKTRNRYSKNIIGLNLLYFDMKIFRLAKNGQCKNFTIP